MVDLDWSKADCWWAEAGERAISRNKLTDRWTRRTPAPKPEMNIFCPELRAWSSQLGLRAWVIDRFGARPAELARSRVMTVFDEPENWNAVSALYREFGDGLARTTGGLAADLVRGRPRGLGEPTARILRDNLRTLGSDLRGARDGDALRSADAATQFATKPPDELEKLAWRYGLGRVAGHLDHSRDAWSATDAEIVEDWIDRNVEKWGTPLEPPPDREPTQAEIEAVRAHLLDEYNHHRAYFEKKDVANLVGEAWERAEKTLQGHIVRGTPLPSDALQRKVKYVRFDEWRALLRGLEKERAAGISNDEQPYTDTADRTVDADPVAAAVEWAQLSAGAATRLRAAHQDSWERRVALEILADPGRILRRPREAQLKQYVRERWDSTTPDDAISNNARQAGGLIVAYLRVALTPIHDETIDQVGTK